MKGSFFLIGCVTARVVAAMSVVAQQTKKHTTIQVCVGVDCRVDGASDCLRMLQQRASEYNNNNTTHAVHVKAVPCLGPCGDGPNAIVVEYRSSGSGSSQRMGVGMESATTREPGSVVPADIFGANTKGVYQVRTSQQADTVLRVATNSSSSTGDDEESCRRRRRHHHSEQQQQRVRSTRAWYDRPRNERLMLQRCMHASILWGLLDCNSVGRIEPTAWEVAAVLWILSNFIMKESLLETFLLDKKMIRKRRKKP